MGFLAGILTLSIMMQDTWVAFSKIRFEQLEFSDFEEILKLNIFFFDLGSTLVSRRFCSFATKNPL